MAKKKQLQALQSDKFIADERLYISEDGKSLVKEGDPRAAFLFSTPGKHISKEDAIKFGLVEDEAKEAKAPANKAKAAPANKSETAEESDGPAEES